MHAKIAYATTINIMKKIADIKTKTVTTLSPTKDSKKAKKPSKLASLNVVFILSASFIFILSKVYKK